MGEESTPRHSIIKHDFSEPAFAAQSSRGKIFMKLVTTNEAMKMRNVSPPAERREFNLLTLSELKDRPQPEWLIKGLFRTESQVVLYGPSGHGKSFVALDWALSIATGQPWLGRKAKQGAVVYVVSEGGRGILKRVTAWMKEKGISDIGPAFFVEDAVQMANNDDVDAFLEDLGMLSAFNHGNPKLIVLDTFARSFVGGEENSATEVGVWIEASRRVQVKTGAAVMAVHHSGKPKDNGSTTERGSSALRAASETMIRVTLDEKKGVVTIKNDKQKEDEPFELIRLQSKQVIVGYDEDGAPVTSLVLVPSSPTPAAGDTSRVNITKDVTPAFEALRAFPSGAADSGEWKAAITKDGQPVSESSFHRWRNKLLSLGFIEEVPTKAGRYRVRPDSSESPTGLSSERPIADYPHSQPPVGVGVEVAGEEV